MSSHHEWTAYQYYPSKAAAVVFIILFGAITLLHTYHLIRTRTLFFIPLVVGGYFEFAGYIGRAMSASQSPDWTLGPYVIQSTLLLVAPALFAASIYMELGRIIRLVRGEKLSLVKVTLMTKIFVAGDVLSFLMQASGAGIMVKGSWETGQDVILGGLFVQIIFFCFFLGTAITFQRRIARHPTTESFADVMPWRKHMMALHTSSVLILVRSVIRVVEYIQGNDGFILSHEAFLYCFDGLLMWLVMVVFVLIHPSEVNCLLGKGRTMTVKGGLSVCEPSIPI